MVIDIAESILMHRKEMMSHRPFIIEIMNLSLVVLWEDKENLFSVLGNHQMA
jgi:hypothetical protein